MNLFGMIRNGKVRLFFGIFLVMNLIMMGAVSAVSYTYTNDADFDEGTMVGVEHETVHNQLQLITEPSTLPFIWVPNNEDTISKVDTDTGNELGRYMTGPSGVNGQPSRTTVDIFGNVWVGNRYSGTAVKVGLFEAGQCIDINGNGSIETSQDLNNDGDITGDEILPWGTDECVLLEIGLVPGSEGPFVPGTFPGPYYNDWDFPSPGPRSIAVDANNNVWIGTYGTQKFYHIDGTTGAILEIVDVAGYGHNPYGAIIDENGVLWSSSLGGNHLLRLDPSVNPPDVSKLNLPQNTYGLGIDQFGHLFVSGWVSSAFSRVDVNAPAPGVRDWTKSTMYKTRGVAVTSDNNVWIASTDLSQVRRYNNDGTELAIIDDLNEPMIGPMGLSVDSNGKVWTVNINNDFIHRINPATNSIDLSKEIVGSQGHYGYSDMTGIVARSVTTKTGTWTVVVDDGDIDNSWKLVSWNSFEPAGTSITIKVRSSNDMSSWSPWEEASNGNPLLTTPGGRFLQVQVTLQEIEGDISPILYDLTVEEICTDGDIDGFATEGGSCSPADCNDTDNTIYPGAPEICDEQDNQCPGDVGYGEIDEGVTTTYYLDSDSDSYGNPSISQEACSHPANYTLDNTDCDDGNPNVNPGVAESTCDGIDNDCDSLTLDNPDNDSDGYGICDGECDDIDPNINPGATEICNGIDDNCDGNIDFETKVTNDISVQSFSSIYNDRIVYSAINGNQDIFMYDLSTGTETQITTNPSLQSRPHIYQDKIVWTDSRQGNSDIYMYDLSTSIETQITTDTTWQFDPAIFGDKIAYTFLSGDNRDIHMYDISSGIHTQITFDITSQERPAIYGDKIVWVDERNGNGDIYMYDIPTGIETQITTDPSTQSYPDIYENKIVWADWRNGNADVYLYDISTGIETRITTDPSDQRWPHIHGDKIVYMDDRNGNEDMYVYDLSARTETQITTNSADQWWPEIYGDKIIWLDYRDFEHNIYLHDLNEGICQVACPDNDGDIFTDSACGGLDCDDTDLSIYPEANEICDGKDNQCPGDFGYGEIDEGVTITFYQDLDSDSYGNPAATAEACSAPGGYVIDNTDCDDSNGEINPGEAEVCDDGIDNNCDTFTDCADGSCATDPVCETCTISFPDVPPTHWAYSYIEYLFCNGIVNGYPDGTFQPGNSITRGQFAKMIVNANGISEYYPATPTFSDVPSDHWSYGYVEAAVQAGIISGYPDGTFRPANQVTRAQMAKMIANAKGWTYSGPIVTQFPDVPPPHWAYEYIMACYEHGIFGGYPDTSFGPSRVATRGQNSKMIANMMQTP